MAQINIETTAEEQAKVLDVIRKHEGETIAMSTLASEAGLNKNRIRYVIADLEESGKVRRVPTKAFNAHYIRYKYEVLV